MLQFKKILCMDQVFFRPKFNSLNQDLYQLCLCNLLFEMLQFYIKKYIYTIVFFIDNLYIFYIIDSSLFILVVFLSFYQSDCIVDTIKFNKHSTVI
jgi:hypothetical protein